jgi:hypothetical protein
MIESYEIIKKYIPGLKLVVSNGICKLELGNLILLETTSDECMKAFCVGLMVGFTEALKQDRFTIKK